MMAEVVIFNEAATPQQVVGHLKSVHTPDYSSRTDVVLNPDLSLVEGIVPRKFWKHVAGVIVEYTQTEKDAQDAAEAAAADLSTRTGAKAQLDGFARRPLVLRALADIIKDEINILRGLHGLPDRTLAQLRVAIGNRIDGGSIDS